MYYFFLLLLLTLTLNCLPSPSGRPGQGAQQLHHEVQRVVRLALPGGGKDHHRQPGLLQGCTENRYVGDTRFQTPSSTHRRGGYNGSMRCVLNRGLF